MSTKRRHVYLYGGAIGDALMGIHTGRLLSENAPGTCLELVSTRRNGFVKEMVADLPFIVYRELDKKDFTSWIVLPGYLFQTYNSAVYEPVTSVMPVWWRTILWCARQRAGIHVRLQRKGHESPVSGNIVRRVYDCQKENFFTDTTFAIVGAWGVDIEHRSLPSLPRRPSLEQRPYLLFHFFAANYRRSIPVDQARAILLVARKKFPTHQFIVTCAEDEVDRAVRMTEGVCDTRIEANLPAPHMIALLSGADMVVGTASGIIFLAVHLGVSVIALSCLVDPCFLPTYSKTTTILAARDECLCDDDKMGRCTVDTPEGEVFRCLYYIPTQEVIDAMVAYTTHVPTAAPARQLTA